jgi:hypothetical protein
LPTGGLSLEKRDCYTEEIALDREEYLSGHAGTLETWAER